LQFDFDSLILAGFKINLGGNAVDIGEKTGLGSGTGVTDKETKKKKAFFNWGVADEKIATARGGGEREREGRARAIRQHNARSNQNPFARYCPSRHN